MHLGGVGFSFKWNMGWMNDTLHYFEKDPVYRRHEHNKITFSFMYAWSENFVLPISHDEVVHGKKSLLDKMPGDEWQKRANYRLFLSYMTAHPGKKLMFMGSEFGQWHEWREHEQLDWPLLQNPVHRGLQNLNRELAKFYKAHPQLHASDCDAGGFRWSDLHNADESVFAFLRQEHGHAPIVCVFNATPVPREDYWLGVPDAGRYEVIFDSDHPDFGGAGFRRRLGLRGDCPRGARFPARVAHSPAATGCRVPEAVRRMKDGSPDILGATFTGDGVNFAVRSRAATRVDVCLYDSTGERETARLTLAGRTGRVHHGFVEQELARVGTLYGIRVHGVYDPREGYRFNANKLLIDPWARDIVGDVKWHPSILGYDPTDAEGTRPSLIDSAPAMPRCRVIDAAFDWEDDRAPAVPWRDTFDLRAARQGLHAAASGCAARMARQISRAHRAGGARTSEVAGRDRGRAHAGARLHQRGLPARARPH